jgi:hypothetical protein
VITENNLLDEAGHRLVHVWADEQGLKGFYGGVSGPGAILRADLTRAVVDGLRDGRTGPRPGRFSEAIAAHLDPSDPGRNERTLLKAMIDDRAGKPDEVRFLTQALQKRGATLEFRDEANVLRSLCAKAPDRLAATLKAIEAYEEFCRPLTDTFNWLRYLASTNPQYGVSAGEFVKLAPVEKLTDRLTSAIGVAGANDILAEVWPDRADVLARLQEIRFPTELLEVVFAHHREVQHHKPPDGKRAWIEESSRERLLVRASYRLESAPPDDLPYVHEYRLPTLSRFLADLGSFS